MQVAPLFTENFDYQFFYPDFVNGLLTSDLLGKTICCTILDSDPSSSVRAPAWAGAVTNTKSYDAVSRAILARKAYPLAPDENMPDRSGRYEQRRARVYYGKDVDLSRCAPLHTCLRAAELDLTWRVRQHVQDLFDVARRHGERDRAQHIHHALGPRGERRDGLVVRPLERVRLCRRKAR